MQESEAEKRAREDAEVERAVKEKAEREAKLKAEAETRQKAKEAKERADKEAKDKAQAQAALRKRQQEETRKIDEERARAAAAKMKADQETQTKASASAAQKAKKETGELAENKGLRAQAQAAAQKQLKIDKTTARPEADKSRAEQKAVAAPPAASELAAVFEKLSISKYLPAFEAEDYIVSDLANISEKQMEKLIPQAGPRSRLEIWIKQQALCKLRFILDS